MNRFKISRQADLDLEDLWVYLAQYDAVKADQLLGEIFNKFPMLAQFPSMGKMREEIAQGLRSFPVKPYIIFYKPMIGWVEIVRILHQSRDIDNLFDN